MTNTKPITDKEARDYVASYLTRYTMPVEIFASYPSSEGDGAVDVVFLKSGHQYVFTVWRESDGSIYGEW